MSEATPRPWRAARHGAYIDSVDGRYIAQTSIGFVDGRSVGECAENRSLIVRAVNSFDDLVAACEAVVARFDAVNAGEKYDEQKWAAFGGVDELRAALAKARGEK